MTTETNFTPGPWEASFTDCFGGPADYCRIRPESGEMFGHFTSQEIATMYIMDEAEQQANAHLIAAAPDLLESLTNLVGLAKLGAARLDKYQAALSDAEAAIAKARGES